jgi:hypothetical protein
MGFGSDDIGLLFRAKGDNSDAKKAFADLKTSVTKDVTDIEGKAGSAFEGLAQKIGLSSTSASGLSAVMGPVGIAIGAVTIAATAAASAAVSLSVKLFDLAESAAAFGGSIKDAVDKTGASAETLQAFKFAAEQSGSSLEKVSGSVAKFSTLLGQAENGNKKAEATLAQYGITAKDIDTALIQAVKTISSMTDSTQQSAAAAALFRDRAGDILPVIKQMNGDIPAVIKQLQDMGLMMSGKAIDAADELDDQLKTLHDQFAGIARTIGVQLMPVFLDMSRDISRWIKSNQAELRSWADTIATTVRGAMISIYAAKDAFNALGKALAGDYIGASVALGSGSVQGELDAMVKDRLEQLKGTHGEAGPRATSSGGSGGWFADDTKKKYEEWKKQREDAYKQSLKDQDEHLKLQLDKERDYFQQAQDLLDKSFQNHQISEEQYRKSSDAARDRWRTESHKILVEQEHLTGTDATAAGKRNLADKRVQAEEAIGKAILGEREAVNKAITDQQKAASEEQIKLAKDAYDQDVARFESTENKKRALSIRFATEEGVDQANLARISERIDEEILNHRLEAARTYRDQLSADTDAYNKAQLSVEQLEDQVEQQRAEHATNEHARRMAEIDDEQRVRDEKNKSWHEYIQRLEEQRDRENDEKARKAADEAENSRASNNGGVSGGIAGALGVQLPSLTMIDDQGKVRLKSQAEYIKSVYADVKNMAGQAIGSMIDGLSNLVAQWIITGKFSGKAALGMVAQIALSLAMQAGIKAIFELAEGFAALAVTWGVPNPSSDAHFAAAGIYGTIAGVSAGVGVAAALGARAMGGSSQTSGAYGSAGSASGATRSSGSGGTVYSSLPDQEIDQYRNNPRSLGKLTVEVKINKDTGMLEYAQHQVNTNGGLRGLILDVATGG